MGGDDSADSFARAIRARLVEQRGVPDAEFDELLSAGPRSRSAQHWSRVEVAQTASRWLSEAGAMRVLDVGSGAGKFCAIASLTSSHRVWGVEARGALVLESRRLAQRLDAEVVIIHGTLDAIDPTRFDAFYFFNPFEEHLSARPDDPEVQGSVRAYLTDVKRVEAWLRAAPVGTTMVTYNGLGGRIPLGWANEKTTPIDGDLLRLWVKRSADDGSTDALIEFGEQLLQASQLVEVIRRRPGTPVSGFVAHLLGLGER